MRILIFSLNYAPELVGIGPYSTGMAEALAAAGHQVEVVAAKPYYPAWSSDPDYRGFGARQSVENNVRVTRIPIYVPAEPSGMKRILHHISLAVSAALPLLRAALFRRPDLVITVAPSLIAAPIAWAAAKLARAPLWLHIQDFEVEAAFATGLVGQEGRAARAALGFERWMLRSADMVSTISPQMMARAIAKGVAPGRVIEFRNWAKTGLIVPLDRPSDFAREWGIETPHVALYSGNIANKQGVETIVEAARLLKDRDDLTFVICGEGPNRSRLAALSADLPNVRLYGLQPEERLSELLGLASVHLLPQIPGAADLLLPSKLANMLASGRPVVATAALGSGLADEVKGCGLVTTPGDAGEMAAAIACLLDDRDLAARLGAAGAERAQKQWSQTAILDRFVRDVQSQMRKTDGPGAALRD